MSADVLLSRLDGVKPSSKSSKDRWVARCPAHADRHPSLTVRELPDGRVLAKCWSGCTITEVLNAVGLDFSALFPATINADGTKPERRAFSAADILRAVSKETMIVALAALDLAKGKPLPAADLDRLKLAATRLQAAAKEYTE